MAFLDLTLSGKPTSFGFDAERALRVPIGAASPLWLVFAGAASVGLGVWWMSRLMKPMAYLAPRPPAAEPLATLTAPEAVPERVVQSEMEAVAEPVAADPAVEATVEATEAPVVMVDAPADVTADVAFPIADALFAGVDAIADPIEEPAPASALEAEPDSIAAMEPDALAEPRKSPGRASAKPTSKRATPPR